MSLDPSAVPVALITDPADLPDLHQALATGVRVAIDTEVPITGPSAGRLRVMSVATRDLAGTERAFVVDARDIDPTTLRAALTGVTADGWNASFDARVLDAAVWGSDDVTHELRWWDAQLADALLHQGRSGFTWYHGLAWATRHYLGIEADGKGTTQVSFTADGDLTPDQIAYAAADAVETLWVGDAIRREIAAAGLDEICSIEMAARPFLDRMERTGLPFDWPGWEAELATIAEQHRAAIGHLAELTGGGQGTLFDDVVEPTWNPASDRQVRQALNRWAPERVAAWFATDRSHLGDHPRRLTDLDSVNASVLREIGGELCDAILAFRNLSKILTTYGESIGEHLDDDGRLRPQYLQVVGTNTGRLASRNPNAQNFTPRMKPFCRPADPDRVFVHADLSQAELRYLAQVADDEPLRTAFARGDDVHVTTAATMFGFEPGELRASDPGRFAHLRQIAKALNFGIAYGTGAAALARSLTAEGAPTTIDEATDLLARYRRTYPGTAAWAEARIAEIQVLRGETADIDWAASLRLARGFAAMASVRREFRSSEGRWPSPEEIAERHPDRGVSDHRELLDEITWLSGYSAPVALLPDGRPFTFSSRTLAGRRQQFNLHLDRLLLVAATEAIQADGLNLQAVRDRFERANAVQLTANGQPLSPGELATPFEDRALRRRYIEAVVDEVGFDVAVGFLARAARERVGAMVNAWRNAPIQGGVADIMLVAYGDLDRRLGSIPSAVPVQTVHDSVVVECDRIDAPAVADALRSALDGALRRFCPDVEPKTDVDIRTSLAEADVVPDVASLPAAAHG